MPEEKPRNIGEKVWDSGFDAGVEFALRHIDSGMEPEQVKQEAKKRLKEWSK